MNRRNALLLQTTVFFVYWSTVMGFGLVPKSHGGVGSFAVRSSVRCNHNRKPGSVRRLSAAGKENNNMDGGGAAATTAAVSSLNFLESWCTTRVDLWYSRSLSIRCPFIRRRTADVLDGVDAVMRFLVIRHKSLDLIGPPPGCRTSRKKKPPKDRNLPPERLLDTLRGDWREDTHKGYYITGKLDTAIYRDDCLFDGPDPDMPVRGLRKYLSAASHLFDHSRSTAELLSLATEEDSGDDDDDNSSKNTFVIVAKWKLRGVLHLPWHPELPVWTGSTRYHFDDEGLIYLHEESWDISVFRAFAQTLFPEASGYLWRER